MTRRSLFAFAVPALVGLRPAQAASGLKMVSRLYIEKMENDFDDDLRIQITRQFRGRVNVVLDREVADAFLVGKSQEDKAGGTKATLRYLGLNNVNEGTLTLIDKTGKVVLWSDEASDRAPWFSGGGMNAEVKKTLAERLVRKLKRAIDRSA
ncbi:MAG: hypothetical protein JST65_10425 [Acidobacteria bacterium]|nr:hypothetical protein [Acidobacteriota bacterium]